MKRNRLPRILSLGGLILALAVATSLCAAPRPNFIFILVDDLGWKDLGFMGSDFYETPHIDKLAGEGMVFEQAYAACTVCSPTRAAVMTGKYPARLNVTDWIKGHRRPKARLKVPDWTMQLELKETTIAEALKKQGYVTGHIGKWHLGDKGHWPEDQGFDSNVGGYQRGAPPSYFSPYRIPTLKNGPKGEYLTDREAREAAGFVTLNKDKPFFLYLPHYAVHTPLQGKKAMVERYAAKADPQAGQRNARYAAMIESLDEAVGTLQTALKTNGVADRTLIFFTSDNGGLTLGRPTQVTSNSPLRAGKGSTYEGGVRVPLIVKWPGVIPPGSRSGEPVISIDYFPTILEIAGATEIPAVDGRSLVPVLKQSGGLQREAIYWHYPHYHPGGSTPYGAIRMGDMKLIEFYETGRLEMYDLARDLGESRDLGSRQPKQAAKLHAKLMSWRQSVDAQMPSKNPDYDRSAKNIIPDYVIRQAREDSILLHARDVTVHGQKVRYEPQPHKNTVGYWTQVDDWVSWDFIVTHPGAYAVEILQGCGPGNGGSDVDFIVDDQKLPIIVTETKGFQDFLKRNIGTFEFKQAGRYTLEVRPRRKTHVAVMDLRQVRLVKAD